MEDSMMRAFLYGLDVDVWKDDLVAPTRAQMYQATRTVGIANRTFHSEQPPTPDELENLRLAAITLLGSILYGESKTPDNVIPPLESNPLFHKLECDPEGKAVLSSVVEHQAQDDFPHPTNTFTNAFVHYLHYSHTK